MTGKQVVNLYGYHNWANKRLLNHLKELPEDLYEREIESVFPSVAVVVEHIYQADGMWLSVMSGDSFREITSVIGTLKEETEDRSLANMERLYTGMAQKYENFLQNHEDLDSGLTIKHPKYGELTAPVAELVRHVVNHGTYHRGNITAMLRQQGHAGVPTDYIFYQYERRG